MSTRHQPKSRMCAWCAQGFYLGKRRYWTQFCCNAHWYLAHLELTSKTPPRDFAVAQVWLAGGDGHLHLTDARVYEQMAPARLVLIDVLDSTQQNVAWARRDHGGGNDGASPWARGGHVQTVSLEYQAPSHVGTTGARRVRGGGPSSQTGARGCR